MAAAYSMDLRERVIQDSDGGLSSKELAQRYHVSSVPKTVVGENHEFVGAGPESMLLKHVQDAAAAAAAAPAGLIV